MSRKNRCLTAGVWGILFLFVLPALARVQVSPLAEKLLYGDHSTRLEAVNQFNKLPSEAQYKLVPDFMVAMSDEDPEVRKIAARILKAMGLKTEGQVPDAKKELTPASTKPAGDDKWAEERKMKEAAKDQWSDLKKMKKEEKGDYASLKEQMELEKKGQVALDPTLIIGDLPKSASPLSSVVVSLKDSDPWVRAQAARRLAMVRPSPIEAIPDLIKMLGDKEPESRRAAVAALGSFGPLAKDAIMPLNAALSDPDPTVRQITVDALKQIRQQQ